MNHPLPCPAGHPGELRPYSGMMPTLEEQLLQEPEARCSKAGCGWRFVVMSLTEWNTRNPAMSLADRLHEFGYEPGEYMIVCHSCKKRAIADKRAIRCQDCAMEKAGQT